MILLNVSKFGYDCGLITLVRTVGYNFGDNISYVNNVSKKYYI